LKMDNYSLFSALMHNLNPVGYRTRKTYSISTQSTPPPTTTLSPLITTEPSPPSPISIITPKITQPLLLASNHRSTLRLSDLPDRLPVLRQDIRPVSDLVSSQETDSIRHLAPCTASTLNIHLYGRESRDFVRKPQAGPSLTFVEYNHGI